MGATVRVHGDSRAAAFVAEAWYFALSLSTEPLLALLAAHCSQHVSRTRSTATNIMATNVLVSTSMGAPH